MTTVCLVSEYFPPHAPGGAEWSTDALARALAARGRRVLVVTPNYGAPSREERDGFTVIRFPFPVKRPPGRATVAGRYHANPIFYLYAGLVLARIARREKVDLIHVQTKHMLIPGTLARSLAAVPVVATLRDGSIIDAAPMCLHHGDRMPADCGVAKLWRDCAVEYFDLYVKGRRSPLATRLVFLYRWLDAEEGVDPRLERDGDPALERRQHQRQEASAKRHDGARVRAAHRHTSAYTSSSRSTLPPAPESDSR